MSTTRKTTTATEAGAPLAFVKMHGAGNDYVYLDLFRQAIGDPVVLARLLSDRHFGIGADGLILIMPSEIADLRMRMFNADGSEAEMCGNGIRCVAKYAVDEGLAPYPALSIETGRGVLTLEAWRGDSGRVERVTVGMGRPDFDRAAIPVAIPGEGPLLDHPVELQGMVFRISTVSMGNPHCVVLVDDCERVPVESWGPLLETAPFFPRRANVEFVSLLSPGEARIRTWERGSGETLACGTGASAVCAVLTRLGHADGSLKAHLRGGELDLRLDGDAGVFLTGPAVEVFRGVFAPG